MYQFRRCPKVHRGHGMACWGRRLFRCSFSGRDPAHPSGLFVHPRSPKPQRLLEHFSLEGPRFRQAFLTRSTLMLRGFLWCLALPCGRKAPCLSKIGIAQHPSPACVACHVCAYRQTSLKSMTALQQHHQSPRPRHDPQADCWRQHRFSQTCSERWLHRAQCLHPRQRRRCVHAAYSQRMPRFGRK